MTNLLSALCIALPATAGTRQYRRVVSHSLEAIRVPMHSTSHDTLCEAVLVTVSGTRGALMT
jgi:hypothetical protein